MLAPEVSERYADKGSPIRAELLRQIAARKTQTEREKIDKMFQDAPTIHDLRRIVLDDAAIPRTPVPKRGAPTLPPLLLAQRASIFAVAPAIARFPLP